MAAREKQPDLSAAPALRSVTALVTLRVGPPGPAGQSVAAGAVTTLPAEEAAGLVARGLAIWQEGG